PVGPEAADQLVTDLGQVAGVEERAAAEEGVLNALGMGIQRAALGEEVGLGVEAVGSVHAKTSLRPSKELCPGPPSNRRGARGYDAQSREKRQAAGGGAPVRGGSGGDHWLGGQGQFVGRQGAASSA